MSKSKKLLDFQANISDVKQINPLFSTCRVRVLYTGKNRNMSTITKSAVEKALPTIKNIPIVGEFSEANKDYKGHGGAIDLDSYKFIHTTKPYGLVPESATYEWEEVKGSDGSIREYLTIDGCLLWTGRYEEGFSIIENGKGQSMEIEVTDGRWDDVEESYQIDNFLFSALCILGDDVEPAFEDARITAYSLNKDSFKKEFSIMMDELKISLNQEKEVNEMKLKELLAKYSITMEDLTAKGLDFSAISEDELEAKIAEALGVEIEVEAVVEEVVVEIEATDVVEVEAEETVVVELADVELETNEVEAVETVETVEVVEVTDAEQVGAVVEVAVVDTAVFETRIAELEAQLEELEELRAFKLNVEKVDHEAKVQKLFSDFQLNTEDVEGLDIHKFSVEEIEEKCYAILGRKMASKKEFSVKTNEVIRLPLGNEKQEQKTDSRYGDLFDKYN